MSAAVSSSNYMLNGKEFIPYEPSSTSTLIMGKYYKNFGNVYIYLKSGEKVPSDIKKIANAFFSKTQIK